MATPIVPGLGIDSLVLGQLLYNTIAKLKELEQPLKIAYAPKKYLQIPILVTLPKLGVRLMFRTNELVLIEVVDFSLLQLSYNGNCLNDIVYSNDEESGPQKIATPPTLREIYNKIFGPTFPGKLDVAKRTYILSYPGIAFKFRIELQELAHTVSQMREKNDVLSQLTNWHRGADITCVLLAIFKGEDYGAFHKLLKAPLLRKDLVNKVSVTLSTGTAEFSFWDPKKTPETVRIGITTQQDMLRILGPPDAYFNKFDSRLLIHKHLKVTVGNPGSVYKFHNYFRLGLDFLYNLNAANQGGVLEKIIIHNGSVVESLDFMQWNSCNWVVETEPKGPAVNSSMYFDQFSLEFVAAINNHQTGPVLLNRNEALSNDDMEIVHVADKQVLLEAGELAKNEFKTWGQLRLYGYSRCIWEVIESNNCVSCVTVY